MGTRVNLTRSITFRDTKANVEANSAAMEETTLAYATDTNELGIYTNGAWVWIGGASAFTDLSDVPSSYSGQGGKIVKVNAGATGLEFAASAGKYRIFAWELDGAGSWTFVTETDGGNDIPVLISEDLE